MSSFAIVTAIGEVSIVSDEF